MGVEPCAQQRLHLIIVLHSFKYDYCGLVAGSCFETRKSALFPTLLKHSSCGCMECEGHMKSRSIGLVFHQVTNSSDLALASSRRERPICREVFELVNHQKYLA